MKIVQAALGVLLLLALPGCEKGDTGPMGPAGPPGPPGPSVILGYASVSSGGADPTPFVGNWGGPSITKVTCERTAPGNYVVHFTGAGFLNETYTAISTSTTNASGHEVYGFAFFASDTTFDANVNVWEAGRTGVTVDGSFSLVVLK